MSDRAAKRGSTDKTWLVIAVSVTVGVLGVAFATWQALSSKPEGGAMMNASQFTNSSGLALGASFSPDSKQLAYSSDQSGRFEIYMRALDGEGNSPVQITSDARQNLQPAWSPDGRWIAFYSAGRRGICIVCARGEGTVRQLTSFGSDPAWSPDSKRIVFRSRGLYSVAPSELFAGTPSTIWEVSAAGGEPRQLTKSGNPDGAHAMPAWSPDGRTVVFTNASSNGATSIYGLDPATSQVTKLVEGYANALLAPVFSSDGRSLFYTGVAKSREVGIFRVAVNPKTFERTGAPVELARKGRGVPRFPVISPDGKTLAYTDSVAASELFRVQLKLGSEPKVLRRDSTQRATQPAFSPDGSHIAYIARGFGAAADLWVVNADGKNPVAVSTDPAPEFLPSWSTDGKLIFSSTPSSAGVDVWRHAFPSGLREKVVSAEGSREPARVAPDGSYVLHTRGRPLNVWRTDVATGRSKQLTNNEEGAGSPAISRDGKQIAVQVTRGDDTHVGLIGLSGGPVRPLVQDAGQALAHDWSPDNRSVAYAGFYEGAWNIFSVEAASGEKRKWTNYTSLGSSVRYPAWSPKQDEIVFELGTTRGNIYLLKVPQ